MFLPTRFFPQLSLALLGLGFLCGVGEAQELLPGELPVRSGFELVGRKNLPTLSELEALLAKKSEARALVTGRIRVSDTSVVAPRWNMNGKEFQLAFQKADLKQEQSKVVAQKTLLSRPGALINDEYSYESMLIWAGGRRFKMGPGYSLVSNVTGSSQVHVGALGGEEPLSVSTGDTIKRHPSAYVRGTAENPDVQVVFDAGKDLIARSIKGFSALTNEGGKRSVLAQGTQARWSPDGKQLIYVRELYGEGEKRDRVDRQEIVLLTYRLSTPVIVHSGESGQILRSPTFSPNGQFVAYYQRQKGIDPIWDLYVCDIRSQLNKPLCIGKNLVIDTVFEHVGPAWAGDSKSLYFFSQGQREEEYYPIIQCGRDGKKRRLIQYPKHINVANDIHARSWGFGDFVVFTGIDTGPRELYFLVTTGGEKKKAVKKVPTKATPPKAPEEKDEDGKKSEEKK
ncbi:MAG: hypothetical protein P1V97_02335 [Planctomycetota bacterium]|nr:hypothetical protein [Planctomycetota bacterium]